MENIIILGTGCAGLTAGIYAARANLNPLIIEGPQPGGQLTTTSEVENFPGFSKGIDGYELMNEMRKQAEKFGARFAMDWINSVEILGKTKRLISKSAEYEAKSIIICTGASPKLLGIPGESELFGGKGVTTCATCDGAFYRNMDVVVIGGGDSACEEALFLTHFCSKVTMIHRRDELRASKIMANRIKANAKIHVEWDSVVEEIYGVKENAVTGIKVLNLRTNTSKNIPCKGVFLAIGHTPNTQAFKDSLPLDSSGYIVTEPNSNVRTNISGVYAAGDCVDHKYRQAITAAGMGCQASIELERWLAGQETPAVSNTTSS